MVHNDQASGSHGGGGYARPTNLNNEEAQILADNQILDPPVWHLTHGWNVFTGRYVGMPEGPLLDEYIEQRWEALSSVQRDLPEWAPSRAVLLPILSNKQELELARYFGPYHGRYNVIGHRAYWHTRDVDTVLWEHGYRAPRVDPGTWMDSLCAHAMSEVVIQERLLGRPHDRALHLLPPATMSFQRGRHL
jgi:hypothetical protein